MTTVMHGRRRGTTRATPTQLEPPAPSMHLPDGTDLRQVTVLSKADWSRIHDELNRRNIEEERVQRIKAEKEAQRQKSKEIVKNWGNTIAGQRQKKLQARRIREQKEEEERVLIDIEEAKYQAAQRKEAIDKAKTQQYYQTDRVKNFHGALLLTEVLKEREAQLDLKKMKDRANDGKDKEWLERVRREYEEGIQREQAKAQVRLNAAAETCDFQKLQVAEHMRMNELQKAEDIVEGEELKKLGIQFQEEKEQLEKIQRQDRQQLMFDNVQQIEDTKMLSSLQARQEEEEDDECRMFAAAKRKMMKMRAEKENQIHHEKQRHLEQIRDKLRAQMKDKVDNEDERILRAEQEIEEKKLKEDQARAEKVKKMIQESTDHRHESTLKKEQERKAKKREELELIQLRKAADEIFKKNEYEKSLLRKAEDEKLKAYHTKQVEQNKTVEELLRQEQLALDKANVELLGLEEKQFQEYAQAVIKHCKEGGRNVYPLKKAAQEGAGGGCGPIFAGKGGIRPSYMAADRSGNQLPNFQGATTDEVKLTIEGKGTTKKRIGFVW
ncbi:cilia- and flagella- associated protein 210 [Patella vulgata]|uniref:cilia- and flagella- associated protein 210 n=1 Tax=Patella vulgata TaxID=6465 RepID=UPI0024A9AF18|nr:cilia- and flagella- associated protein 210 [Patella vulgata]